MILGPRYDICPYQPARGLGKPIEAKKKCSKSMKKVPKIDKKGDNFQQGIDSVTNHVVY